MPGYQTKQESIAVTGVDDLIIRSLLDRQQYADPRGEAHRMGISSAMWPLFGLLWPSGAHLAARMALRPVLAGERILELGCGLGLASLVAHRRGADVTASDRHPLAEDFLRENLRLNHLPPLSYRHGDWARPEPMEGWGADPIDTTLHAPGHASIWPPPSQCVHGRFDLLVGSDLLYDRDASAALAGFIERHARAACEVWIIDPDRGNRAVFNRCMGQLGFTRREERLDRVASTEGPAYKGRVLLFARTDPTEGRELSP